uniref:Radical SAM protein n=1 Tax=Candidatus Methanomethylicus mesodigestus TaxID=1867258 RepID=A0A7C3EVF0_9CREN
MGALEAGMTALRVLIIDGYTDEPAGLGVPPFLDVYPRYIAGAVWKRAPSAEVIYITIDEARQDQARVERASSSSDLSVLIAGATVPGKYLCGSPATHNDAASLAGLLKSRHTAICGPAARFGFARGGGSRASGRMRLEDLYEFVITGDPEVVVDSLLADGLSPRTEMDAVRKSENSLSAYAERGARIAPQHPDFPGGLICEIETYRGCPRSLCGGCSFCTEPLHGAPDFRSVKSIEREMAALHSAGVLNFRLGRQPDLLIYGTADREIALPRPNPSALRRLLSAVRRAAPRLRVLHIDNVNPATISTYPDEAEAALKEIAALDTPGDVAAMGVESVDESVVMKNNLKVDYEGAMKAVEIINRVGRERGENGMPRLLPGINFVYGLPGETKATFEINLEFMKDVLSRGLLVRRINLRQVMVMPSTRMESSGDYLVRKHKGLFARHKARMREEVDLPMIKRVVPTWTVLRETRAELVEGNMTWCRQVGSYPILVGVPRPLERGSFYDLVVVSHGPRSVGAIPVPIMINRLGMRELKAMPGLGSRRAAAIIRGRPFKSSEELKAAIDDPSIIAPALPFTSFG